MLSRIAENLYWIGRYIERAENTASLLDVNYHANVEAPVVPGAKGIVTEQWAPLLALTDDEGAFRKYYDRADGRTVPEWLAFHPQHSSSQALEPSSFDYAVGLGKMDPLACDGVDAENGTKTGVSVQFDAWAGNTIIVVRMSWSCLMAVEPLIVALICSEAGLFD